MGMAASQARFLGLTARKTNVEYEGQQINQQRTTLANQSANYYSQLLGMSVPTPPSIADYTKTVYTFTDGSLQNTITSMMAAENGAYKVSYLSSWTDDFSICSAGYTSVVNSQTTGGQNVYWVGKDQLKPLGEGLTTAGCATNADGQEFRLSPSMSFTDGGKTVQLVKADYDKIVSVIGKEPQLSDYSTEGLVINYQQTQCYEGVDPGNQFHIGHMEHNLCKLIWSDTQRSVTSSAGVTLSNDRSGTYSLTMSGWETQKPDSTTVTLRDRLQNIYPDMYQELIDLYIDVALYLNDHKYNNTSYDLNNYRLSNTTYDHNEITPAKLHERWEQFWEDVKNLSPESIYDEAHEKWQNEYDKYIGKYMNSADYTDVYDVTDKLYYDGTDEYLQGMTSEELEQLFDEEAYYQDQLNKLYGTPDNGWYVRYLKNSATGEYYPVFYNGDDMAEGVKIDNGDIYSSVKTYKVGSKQINNEVKMQDARLEKDSSGRYISITLYETDPNGNFINPVTYALTTNTLTDQDAYDDAMNQYEYDKYQYEQSIQEINAKIEIVQAQDKNLELRLKQLDTEQDAIQTEMDAVQKVIEKNTESTFTTFG